MNADYVVFAPSELGIGNAHIINAYIPRESTYGYYYVTGIGVDIGGNLYVYFSGSVKHSGVPIKIYYMSA